MAPVVISLDQLAPDTELSVRHLILALGHVQNYENAQNELGDYWRLRLALLSDAFELPGDWHRDRAYHLIVKVATGAVRPGVFGGLLEYRFEKREADIYARHRPELSEAETAVRSKLLLLATDLLLVRRPALKPKSVQLAELVQAGLPAIEPDPVDFV